MITYVTFIFQNIFLFNVSVTQIMRDLVDALIAGGAPKTSNFMYDTSVKLLVGLTVTCGTYAGSRRKIYLSNVGIK